MTAKKPARRRLIDTRDLGLTARRIASLALYTWRRFRSDRCVSVAASLSYTTLLAIVPLAAVGLAAFSAFPVFEGVQETLQKFIFQNFVPAASEMVRDQFTKFVANTGRLTAIGIVVLAITALMLLSTIEDAFNVIWRQGKSRAFLIRLLTYWAILTLTPLLLGSSLALSSYIFTVTEVLHLEILKGPAGLVLRALPFALAVGGFTALFMIMPNRRVHWSHALAGGLAASILLQILKTLFLIYVTNFPSFETIYGAVSAVPLFLVWMYLTWCAVLVGAELAAAIPEWRQHRKRAQLAELDPAGRLALALGLLAGALNAQKAGAAVSGEDLAEAAGADPDHAGPLVDQLVAARYLAQTDNDHLLLACDLATARLYDLAEVLELTLAANGAAKSAPAWRQRLDEIIAAADSSSHAYMDVPLRGLLDGEAAKRPAAPGKKRPG